MSGSTPSAATVAQADLQGLSNGDLISLVNTLHARCTDGVRLYASTKESLSQERRKRRANEKKLMALVEELQHQLGFAQQEASGARRTAKQALSKNAAIVDALEMDADEDVASSAAGVQLRLLRDELTSSQATIASLERAIRMSGRATTVEAREVQLLLTQREEDRDAILTLRAQLHEGDRQTRNLRLTIEDLQHQIRLRTDGEEALMELAAGGPSLQLGRGEAGLGSRRPRIHKSSQTTDAAPLPRNEAEITIRNLRAEISALQVTLTRKEAVIAELCTHHDQLGNVEVQGTIEREQASLRRAVRELGDVREDLSDLERTHKTVLADAAQLRQQCIELQAVNKKLERKIINFGESEFHRLDELLETERRYIQFSERRKKLEERDIYCETLEQRVRLLEGLNVAGTQECDRLRDELTLARQQNADIELKRDVLAEVVSGLEMMLSAREYSNRKQRVDAVCEVAMDDVRLAQHWHDMAVAALDCRFLEYEVKVRDAYCDAFGSLSISASSKAQSAAIDRIIRELNSVCVSQEASLPPRLELLLYREHFKGKRGDWAPSSAALLSFMGLSLKGGGTDPLTIADVAKGSPAEEGGLEAGMALLGVNFRSLHTVEEALSIIFEETAEGGRDSVLLRFLVRVEDDPTEIIVAL